MVSETLRQRVWDRVNIPGPTELDRDNQCWLWVGKSKYKNGRGRIWHKGRTYIVARLIYEMVYGEQVSDTMVVRHVCNLVSSAEEPNPACCNPRHLEIGTQADNVQDRVDAGRSAFGKRNGTHTCPETKSLGTDHGNAKLNNDAIIFIRALKQHYGNIVGIGTFCAQRFGVTKTQVSRIMKGYGWAHVEIPENYQLPHDILRQIVVYKSDVENTRNRSWHETVSKRDCWKAKLNEDDVLEIVSLHENSSLSGRQIARYFNVTPRTIYDIFDGKTWNHVTGIQSKKNL